MKKRFIVVCLLGVMVLGVSACGDKKEADTAQETQAVSETGSVV